MDDTAHNHVSVLPTDSRRYRTIFLSDIHLGSLGCQAEMLLDFLRVHDCEKLYLVGDIIDGWRLKRSWYWPQAHNDVVQKILRKVRKGTHVYFIPGNHDEFAREFISHSFGGVEVVENPIYETVDGRKLLVTHGDEFDSVIHYAKWLAKIGDSAYLFTLVLNQFLNRVRRRLGFPYWSLSAYLKYKVKNAVNFIAQYEEAVATLVKHRGHDGIVCGHIHHAEMREIAGVLYCNTGDWVESCSALVEHDDGHLEILHWNDEVRAGCDTTTQTQPINMAAE
ncbi:UDP-2,3-diacylglucosamine diphosphatase [Magnetovibrio sp. PR-2]|uniref:UDP-2,3-diacylglucosamine diphosphatase n=1 Tax=Magnetovibrio sp. PR-2 TaxID=3120356 RepID=UPI002FCE39FA